MSKDKEMLNQAEQLDQSDDVTRQQQVLSGKVPGKTFDAQIMERFIPFVQETMQLHGDMLRSVIVACDYYGPANTAPGIHHVLMVGPEGTISSPEGIIGSLQVTQIAMEELLERAVKVQISHRNELTELLGNIVKVRTEYEELTTEVARLKAEKAELEKEA